MASALCAASSEPGDAPVAVELRFLSQNSSKALSSGSDASRTIYGYADNNVISATNLRLANISLAYNLPNAWLRNISLSRARLQFNVENAVTFAKSTSAKYLLGGYNAPNYVFGLYLDF